mmetsp:Transcript_16956/g.45259  ORF Transcript_16956/g.45259 Transcript_16956/m.45259 type:complete len:1062 (+) Transcript_16956:2328-5513(+)
MSPQRRMRDASPRLVEMHNLHKQKLARWEKKKDAEEERELMRIKHDAEVALPMRIAMKAQTNFDPHEVCDRLYKEYKHIQVNRSILQQKFEDEEEKKLQDERTRPRPPAALPKHDIDRFYEGVMDWENKRRQNLERAQESKIHQERKELDLVGRNAKMRTLEETPWQRLHEDAKKRSQDLKDKRGEEEQRMALNMVGPPKGRRGANLDHINKLFYESEARARKNTEQCALWRAEEARKYRENARKAMSPTALSRKGANSKLSELPAHRDPMLLKNQEPELKMNRRCEPLDPMGHVLLAINAAAAQRCACAPEDPQSKGLAAVGLSLKEAMKLYRTAATASDGAKKGCSASLKGMKSQRLYAEGQLMEEEEGFRRCCAPDPIRQLTDDFESLFTAAQRAQAALLMTFIDTPTNFQELDKRWPAGSKHSCVKAAPTAAFAYNPGPKSKQAACIKAQVQFGPSEGARRFMHLLDLARISLVFKDSSLLRTGLEHILASFEVVQVRNHYQPHMQGLLGERWVEVLVVFKDGLTFPVVCEIRLEEECFFNARMQADQHVEKVCQGIRALYSKALVAQEAIEYFIKWSLHRPKEIHALTIFRRQLARRHSSSIVAWRRLFGTAPHVDFNAFRETCGKLNVRDRTVEFWQELDPTRSGRISLFEVDQEGIVLLAKLLGRILALAPDDVPRDGEEVFKSLTRRSMLKVTCPGHMDCHEFRTACRPLGFNPTEADRMFSCLDAHGGCQVQPPATICIHDLAWLLRLPCFVDLPSVTLAEPSFDADFQQQRFVQWARAGVDDDYQRPRVPTTSMTTSLQRQLTLRTEASEPASRRSVSLGSLAKIGVELGWLSDRHSESPAAFPSTFSPEQESSALARGCTRDLSPSSTATSPFPKECSMLMGRGSLGGGLGARSRSTPAITRAQSHAVSELAGLGHGRATAETLLNTSASSPSPSDELNGLSVVVALPDKAERSPETASTSEAETWDDLGPDQDEDEIVEEEVADGMSMDRQAGEGEREPQGEAEEEEKEDGEDAGASEFKVERGDDAEAQISESRNSEDFGVFDEDETF